MSAAAAIDVTRRFLIWRQAPPVPVKDGYLPVLIEVGSVAARDAQGAIESAKRRRLSVAPIVREEG